jgi:hypothetical protein
MVRSVTITATVAEVGATPEFLQKLARSFGAERKDIDAVFNEALKLAILGPSDE